MDELKADRFNTMAKNSQQNVLQQAPNEIQQTLEEDDDDRVIQGSAHDFIPSQQIQKSRINFQNPNLMHQTIVQQTDNILYNPQNNGKENKKKMDLMGKFSNNILKKKLSAIDNVSAVSKIQKTSTQLKDKRKSLKSKTMVSNRSQGGPAAPHGHCETNNSYPTPLEVLGTFEEEEGGLNFFEPISYRKLDKIIAQRHPIDPVTKEQFSMKDRITVGEYEAKISDACFCYAAAQSFKKLKKYLKSKFKDEDVDKPDKPESMADIPDSSSSDDSDGGSDSKDLTPCSIALGEGSTIYLQMMKTLLIMFVVLTIINLPIMLFCYHNTQKNQIGNLGKTFKYFTIGNLGQMNRKCSYSSFENFFKPEVTQFDPIQVSCDHGGYIGELIEFGFLYRFDKAYGADSVAQKRCEFIEDPFIKYKVPPPPPLCDPEHQEEKSDPNCITKELKDEMLQVKNQIEEQKLKKHESLLEENPDLELEQKITPFNQDPLCEYQNKTRGNKLEGLWKDRESKKKFEKSFLDNCYYKESCTFDIEGLFDMVSDSCKQRISEYDITSYEYIGVVGCKDDKVSAPFSRSNEQVHKQKVAIVIILCDNISIVILFFFFGKMAEINEEYLEALDDLIVQMKDFACKIDDVKLDRHSQDSRVIKMKIWLHMTKVLDPHKTAINDCEVVDVTLSLYTQASIQCVFKMQDLQVNINEINQKLRSGSYEKREVPDKQDELNDLLQKQQRFEEKYKVLTTTKKFKEGQGTRVEKIPKGQRLKEIQYVFVVFKNSDTNGIVQSIFPNSKSIVPQDKKSKKDRQLFGRDLKFVPILEPDEVIWENLKYNKEEQKIRRYIMHIISCVFLILNTVFTMYLGGFKILLNTAIPSSNCDNEINYLKRDAYKDLLKDMDNDPKSKSEGIFGCYCLQETSPWALWSLIPHNFEEFSDLNPDKEQDGWCHCGQWWIMQILKQILLFFVATSAVFINELVADFFQYLGQYQKKHTKMEEQTTCFRQIFSMEYINMGLIILLSSFDHLGINQFLMGDISSNVVMYGFEPDWYMTYGNKVCIMIFMSSFIVNSKDIWKFLYDTFRRFKDRSFRLNLKLDPEDEDCDKPNSKMRIQSELEALYTGKVFKGEKTYSRMMSTLFVILMYSSGMPILYFLGAVFYFVTYKVNKFLLIHYYKRQTTLTRTIPIFAMEFIKYGLFVHSLFSCAILTNPKPFMTKDHDPDLQPLFSMQTIESIIGKKSKNEFNKFFYNRFEFLHQQLFVVIIICYILVIFVGKTVYGIIHLIVNGVVQGIKVLVVIITKFIKSQIQKMFSRRAEQANDKLSQSMKNAFEESKTIKNQQKMSKGDDQGSPLKQSEPKAKKKLNIKMADIKKALDITLARKKRQEEELEKEKQDILDAIKENALMRLKRHDYSENFYQELTCENLANFYERSKKERQDFYELFRSDENINIGQLTDSKFSSEYKTLILETLYIYRLSLDQIKRYQDFLNSRIVDIEKQIDKYWELFLPVMVKKMKQGYARDRARLKKLGTEGSLKEQLQRRKYEEWALKFSDDVQFHNQEIYPHERRIKILIEYVDDLIQADKDRKENRQGIQDICRMTGSAAQSYFIFDSVNYSIGRKIYYSVEKNIDKEESEEDELEDLIGKNSIKSMKSMEDSMAYQTSDEERSLDVNNINK